MSAQEETVTQAITQDGDHLTVSGGTPASSLGRFSWAMFDFANQPYYTLITTFIFAPYFASGFIGDAVRGQELWGYTQSMAGLVIALGSPILGAIADQTGAREQSQVDRAYRDNDAMAKVEPFVAEIDAAYAWSDIVIARAGALTVAELSAVGVASVLVPLPSAIDDHQRLNAQWLVDAGAAVLMPQQDLTAASLAAALEPLLADPARLLAMANNARALSRPDATETIVSACMECCDERR